MGKVRICVCCSAFFFSFLSLGFSETILLKSGQKVEGKIVEKTDQYVKLDFQGVDLVYYNYEVASITQSAPSSSKIVSPQMESLYQAYTSSRNVPQKQKEKNVVGASKPVVPQNVGVGQKTPAITSSTDLSQLPPEYQKMMQGVKQQGVPGVQSSQQGSSKLPAGVTPEAFISQLPPEYQEMIKSAMGKPQAVKPDSSDEKQ